jgi:hypothetical protein
MESMLACQNPNIIFRDIVVEANEALKAVESVSFLIRIYTHSFRAIRRDLSFLLILAQRLPTQSAQSLLVRLLEV